MDPREMQTILEELSVNYSNFEITKELARLWTDTYIEHDYHALLKAVKSYIAKNKFKPTIADINEQIEIVRKSDSANPEPVIRGTYPCLICRDFGVVPYTKVIYKKGTDKVDRKYEMHAACECQAGKQYAGALPNVNQLPGLKEDTAEKNFRDIEAAECMQLTEAEKERKLQYYSKRYNIKRKGAMTAA